MASLPMLVPTSQVDRGGWVGPAADTSDLHLYIDETGASEGDSDAISGIQNGATAEGFFGLTDMPSDFASMTSLDLEIRHARGGAIGGDNGGGDDDHALLVQIVDSGGQGLTNEITVETGTVGYLAKTEVISFTTVQAGNKTTWDGAQIKLRTTFNQNMGGDGDRMHVHFARLINGVYQSAGESASGGSTSTVTATSEGAGVKDTDGGATSTVATVGSGAGVKKVSGGATSTVTAVATGAGEPGLGGGATSTVTQSAEGAGSKVIATGTTAAVAATSQGAGVKDVAGGATSTVTVVATGAGTSSEGGENKSGGSTSIVTAADEGVGLKEAVEGSTATNSVTSSGAGVKVARAASTVIVTCGATGSGFKDTSGATTVGVTIVAFGAGQSSEDEGENEVVFWWVRSRRTRHTARTPYGEPVRF